MKTTDPTIYFQRVEIEGFQGIEGPFSYTLNRKNLTILQGDNGVGKTTILSALTWATWGQTLKKKHSVTPWASARGKGYKGTQVKVFFKKGKDQYQIIACSDYKGDLLGSKGGNRRVLIKNEEYQADFRDANDVKAEVVRVLGKSFDLAKNSIVFGQKLKRIIQETGPDKKKVFEEAFEIGYINKAKVINDEKLEKQKHLITTELSPKLSTITSQLEHLQNTLRLQKDFNDNRNTRIEALKGKIKKLKTHIRFKGNHALEVKELKAKLESKGSSKLEARAREAERQYFKAEFTYKTSKDSIEHQKSYIKEVLEQYTKIPKTCSNCQQPLSADGVRASKNKVKGRLEEAKKELVDLRLEVANLEETLKVTKKVKSSIDKKLEQVKSISVKIMELQAEMGYLEDIKEYKEDIEAIRKESLGKSFQTPKALKAEILNLQTQANTLIKQNKKADRLLGHYEWIRNSALSNSGIKAYIFQSMLGEVNKNLLNYSKYLKYRIEFGVDLSSARKDFYTLVYRGDEIIDYDELSGGQQQLVDICIAFAIHDTLDIGNPINILFMDEVFENLDSKNIEIVSELIQKKAQEKSVHLITHRPEFSATNAFYINL